MCAFQISFEMSYRPPFDSTRDSRERRPPESPEYTIARKISEAYERADVPVFAAVLGHSVDRFIIDKVYRELAELFKRRHEFTPLCVKDVYDRERRPLDVYTLIDQYMPSDTAQKNVLIAMNRPTTQETLLSAVRKANAKRVVLVYTLEASQRDDFMHHLKYASDEKVPIDQAGSNYSVVSVLLSGALAVLRTCRAMCRSLSSTKPAWMVLEDAFNETLTTRQRRLSPLRTARNRSPERIDYKPRSRSRSRSPERHDRFYRPRRRDPDEESWEPPVVEEKEPFDPVPLLIQIKGIMQAMRHTISKE